MGRGRGDAVRELVASAGVGDASWASGDADAIGSDSFEGEPPAHAKRASR